MNKCKIFFRRNKMIQIAVALTRLALLNPTVQAAVRAALLELQRRGLTVITLNQLREAMIATGYTNLVGQWLGYIAETIRISNDFIHFIS